MRLDFLILRRVWLLGFPRSLREYSESTYVRTILTLVVVTFTLATQRLLCLTSTSPNTIREP